jgi:predicted AlkP superfamily phosphohydrolase/phosphomutase
MSAKVLVLGIDALDAVYFESNKAMLPHLASLAESGTSGRLRSTVPPLTAPAWVTAFSGMNPGKTGITGFIDEHKHIFDSRDVTVPRIWNVLSAQGRRCAVIGVPMAYPVEEINGVMVSGFMTPSTEVPFTYPSNLQKDLLRKGYLPDLGWTQSGMDREHFLVQLRETAIIKYDQFTEWLESDEWDCFIAVLSETDWIQHYLDRPPGHPEHARNEEELLRFFCLVDEYIGRWVAAAGPEATVLVCSDHGFGHFVRRVVHLNRFLVDEGYLKLNFKASVSIRNFITSHLRDVARLPGWRAIRNRIPSEWKKNTLALTNGIRDGIEWEQSRARFFQIFWIVGAVEFNAGAFSDDESLQVARKSLRQKLTELRDPRQNEPIFSEVYLREEVFTGPYSDNQPDIVCLFAEGYGGNEMPGTRLIADLPQDGIPGSIHRRDGVWILTGPNVKSGISMRLDLQDIAPIIYHLLDVSVPENVDGRVPKETFVSNSSLSQRHCPTDDYSQLRRTFIVPDNGHPDSDESVEDRLRALGYIE